jgi:hypothetical protein
MKNPCAGYEVVVVTEPCSRSEGWYCFLMDLPTIEAPKQYREPKLPDDAGKQCEFSDDGKDWTASALTGFNDGIRPWSSLVRRWKLSRIEVTQ